MTPTLASAITKAASRQTYYTIRCLVDRPRVNDAFRAYAYFRWVDDVLDAVGSPGSIRIDEERRNRASFLDRQQALLEACLRGEEPLARDPREAMLVELVRSADRSDTRLEAYLRNMMLVMAFDAERRGRLICQQELDGYTRWLAVAVTEAMHYFIGNGAAAPHDEARYAAVTGAHVIHMLRDTYSDLEAGYVNVPREMLEAASIGPADVRCDAYRAWVEERVRLAQTQFDAGTDYFRRIECRRHRLAGMAYIARFEWLIETLERNGFRLQPEYPERRTPATRARIGRTILSSLARPRLLADRAMTRPSTRGGRP